MDKLEFSIPCQKPENTGTGSGVPNYIEWTNGSAPPFPSGSSHYSCASSTNWRGSRISPVPDLRGTELDQVVALCELHNILKDNQPETLEYPPISLNTVKVSSQNKKRASPPHNPVQEFGSNSPIGLLNQFPVQQMKIQKIKVATNEQTQFQGLRSSYFTLYAGIPRRTSGHVQDDNNKPKVRRSPTFSKRFQEWQSVAAFLSSGRQCS